MTKLPPNDNKSTKNQQLLNEILDRVNDRKGGKLVVDNHLSQQEALIKKVQSNKTHFRIMILSYWLIPVKERVFKSERWARRWAKLMMFFYKKHFVGLELLDGTVEWLTPMPQEDLQNEEYVGEQNRDRCDVVDIIEVDEIPQDK